MGWNCKGLKVTDLSYVSFQSTVKEEKPVVKEKLDYRNYRVVDRSRRGERRKLTFGELIYVARSILTELPRERKGRKKGHVYSVLDIRAGLTFPPRGDAVAARGKEGLGPGRKWRDVFS